MTIIIEASRFRVVRFMAVVTLTATLITATRAQSNYTVADFPISSYSGGIAGFDSGSFRPAQTFTALEGGVLQSISVALAQDGSTPPNHVVVEFRSTEDDMPSSTILASATIDGNLLAGVEPGSPVMLSADFSPYTIDLVSGSVYAFSLRIDEGYAFGCGHGNNYRDYYSGGSLFVSFDSGTTWSEDLPYNLNFQVTAVPEPSALALIGSVMLAISSGLLDRRKEMRRLFSNKGAAANRR